MTESEMLRAANDVRTSPDLLGVLSALHNYDAVLRAVASNPNTPAKNLWQLAVKFPAEVLANPVLPLLHLENPEIGNTISATVALSFLTQAELPDWMLEAFAQGPLAPESIVKSALQHLQVAGETGPDWRAQLEMVIKSLAADKAATFVPGLASGLPEKPCQNEAVCDELRWM